MRLLIALLACLGAAHAGEVRGTVVDARGGERLARVQVRLLETEWQTVTDEEGRFGWSEVTQGDHVLQVATVGYRLLRRPFRLTEAGVVEFEVVLTPDTLQQSESVEVTAGPFAGVLADSPSELTLEGDEMKNLATVLADDPMRAVQGMPGVASNDDFNSFFYLRGGEYHRLGIYLDDVLVHMPFHMVANEPTTGSITLINGDALESLSLHSGVYPARIEDRTVGALEMQMREGSRLGPSFRATASASSAGLLGEGPLGKKASWLASARRSYLQYLLSRASDDSSLAFGFWDVQGKLGYDPGPKHHLSLSVLEGSSNLDRSSHRNTLGTNTLMLADFHLTLANLAWSYTPTGELLLQNRFAYLRERFDNRNPDELDLARGYYGEWVWQSSATWLWGGRNPLEVGWSLRRIRGDGLDRRYQSPAPTVRWQDEYAGTALRKGAYAQQSLEAAGGRLHFTLGIRWDEHETNGVQSLAPQAALAFSPLRNTQVRLGWGQYVQHPDIEWLFRGIGSTGLLPERANHFLASVEQRLDDRTRVRVELYNRDDRDLLFWPLGEPRIVDGEVSRPPEGIAVLNSVRGYSRGFEVFLQKRTANRLTGWVSYGYGRTSMREGITGDHFASDRDQHHTVNVYGSYRLRPTVNLSMKYLYGSGFPVPGYFRQEGDDYWLSDQRNQVRVAAYHRLDVRLNKAYVYRKWKLTLYVEVVNLLDRKNYRYEELRRYNPETGAASLSFGKLFPILPSAGVVFEFGGG